MTMHQQAEILRDPTNPMSPYYDPTLAQAAAEGRLPAQTADHMDPRARRAAVEGREIKHRPQSGQNQPQKGPFGGILPPEAAKDPNFVPGVGSAYRNNQPAVMRQQRQKRPTGERRAALSDDTVEGLEALQNFQKEAHQKQTKAVETSEEGRKTDDRGQQLAEELGLENADAFLSQLRGARDELDDPGLRKQIEERCEPLRLEQLIEEGEIRQEVPIVRDKLTITYRTVMGDEDLEVKRRLYGIQASEQYIFDMLGMMLLTCGVYAINGRPLPTHLDDKRNFDKDLFDKKFQIIRKYPMAMLSSLSINFTWFDQRTRELFVDMEQLKNG